MNRLVVTRTVDQEECPWLDAPLQEGSTVYEFTQHTYGCVDYRTGLAVTFKVDGDYPFFEVPRNAVATAE